MDGLFLAVADQVGAGEQDITRSGVQSADLVESESGSPPVPEERT
jgi:hypothetical protein